jgi:hypothetical protein
VAGWLNWKPGWAGGWLAAAEAMYVAWGAPPGVGREGQPGHRWGGPLAWIPPSCSYMCQRLGWGCGSARLGCIWQAAADSCTDGAS